MKRPSKLLKTFWASTHHKIQFITLVEGLILAVKTMEATQTTMRYINLHLDSKVLLNKWWAKDAHINSTTTIEEIKAKITIHKNE